MRMTRKRSSDYAIEVGALAPDRNLPQKVGRKMWLPMLVMALMAFPIAVVLAAVRSNEIATGGSEQTIASLGHLVPAVMFIGFASVFAAVSFAIARILGEFRVGGGKLQESSGAQVRTLKMPTTAKAFLALMMMAMMGLVGAVVLHFIIAGAISNGSTYSLGHSEQWSIWLEGVRRTGVAVYLAAISLGLATVIQVLDFQITRVQELPQEKPKAAVS